jgi:hypothetical protein
MCKLELVVVVVVSSKKEQVDHQFIIQPKGSDGTDALTKLILLIRNHMKESSQKGQTGHDIGLFGLGREGPESVPCTFIKWQVEEGQLANKETKNSTFYVLCVSVTQFLPSVCCSWRRTRRGFSVLPPYNRTSAMQGLLHKIKSTLQFNP